MEITHAELIEGAVSVLSFIFLWLGRMERKTWLVASQIKNHEIVCADRWGKTLAAMEDIKKHLTFQDNRSQQFREDIIGQVNQLQGRNDAKDNTGPHRHAPDRGI